MAIRPDSLPRRSFLYRQLGTAGAEFAAHGDAAVAVRFPGADEAGRLDRLGFADLSPLPRWGVKGPAAPDWLAAQGLDLPSAANRASRTDAAVIARLSAQEHLLLWPGPGGEEAQARLETAAHAAAGQPLYPLPRRDSHAWLYVVGAAAPACFARLCGVDFRPEAFPDLAVAQTRMARIAVVVIRDDRGAGTPAWHLLWDSASAAFLWQALQDAAGEFDGGPVGLATLEAAGRM